jgi:hypothetical protein
MNFHAPPAPPPKPGDGVPPPPPPPDLPKAAEPGPPLGFIETVPPLAPTANTLLQNHSQMEAIVCSNNHPKWRINCCKKHHYQ